ncbi:hypothetical protein VYU27_009595 [Nannochloropsis oceanica]
MATFAHDDVLEQLAVRLARVEAEIVGPGNEHLVRSLAVSSAAAGGGTSSSVIWRRLLQVTARVETNARRLGDAALLRQLEKDLFMPSQSSSSATSAGAGGGRDELCLPPPSGTALLGLPEKEALILGQEEEFRQTMAYLQNIDELKAYITGPFLEGKGGKEEVALHQRLTKLEMEFWDMEAVAVALAREMEEMLTVYDEVVELLSRKCVEWEGTLASMARRKERRKERREREGGGGGRREG